MISLIGWLLSTLVAGALGGALAGFGEALLVSFTSGAAEEYWLFLFAFVSYGLLGAAVGLGAALAFEALTLGRGRAATAAGVSFAFSLAVPGIVVGRYHVVRRVFHEQLELASSSGILTHALLVAVAIVIGAAGFFLLWACQRSGRGWIPVAAWLLLGVGASVVGFATDRTEPEPAADRKPASRAAAGKPNLILILVDTLRADAVEPLGAAAGSTPGFARFAREAVVFERAYAESSWTRPSIASILTSLHASAHGALHKMDVLPDRALTLAEALRAEGYWTAGFVNNINVAPVFNFQQGFDEYVYLAPSFYFGATDSAAKLAIYKGLRVAREKLSRSMYFPHYYQDAEVLNRRVLRWLEGRPPEPYLLVMHYMDPHDPYFEIPYNGRGVARVMTPDPAPSRARELHDLYLGQTRYLDGYLATFFDRLRAMGAYDRSAIALTADHGEEFQEHGGWWHGTTLYEEALHVPLFFKRPGPAQGGTRRSDFARLIDVAPSLMASAGVRVPEAFSGRDLFTGPPVETLFAETDLEGNRVDSLRAGPWKLIRANEGNPRGLQRIELYDIDADPGEKRNLAAADQERATRLLGELDRVRARAVAGQAFGRAEDVTGAADPRP